MLASKNENHIETKYGNSKVKKSKPSGKQRIRKALEILNKQDYEIRKIDATHYRVKSQDDRETFYLVTILKDKTSQCECKDFVFRHHKLLNNECKHIMAVKLHILTRKQSLLDEPQKDNSKNIISCSTPQVLKCRYCDSTDLKKAGSEHLTKSGKIKPRHYCKRCRITFVRHIDGFEFMMYDPLILTRAIEFVCTGLSYRNAAEQISLIYRKDITHQTIINWMNKAKKILLYYTSQLKPILSDTWLADELELNVKDCEGTEKGKKMMMWNLLDRDSKFWIALHISQQKEIKDAINFFEKRKAATDIIPKKIITDSNSSYPRAIKAAFPREDLSSEPTTTHIQYLSISHSPNNNLIERLHNYIRDIIKARRGLGNAKSAEVFAEVLRIYYNFVRKHSGLGNKTPAEAAGINLNLGDDRLYDLLLISGKKYSDDHKFIVHLRKKHLIRQVKYEDKNGSIFVTSESRYPDETWIEINKIMTRFGFEWRKIENKMMWVKNCSLNQNGTKGNQDGN